MLFQNQIKGQPVWFCLRTHRKHENIAAAHLRHIVLELFNPQLRIERLTRRGRVRSTEPLFMNYIFARAVLETTIERVRYTPTVKTVVQFGDRVATIADTVIEELRQTLAENVETIFTDAPTEGEEAEISSGAFEGEKGIVTRVLPARQRVEILLEIMGRPLPTEFSLSSVIFKRRTAASAVLAGVLQ
jgi:transcription antitermination factor NusG